MVKCSRLALLFVLCSVFAFFAATSAYATFISPGKVDVDFTPNLEKDFTFIVGDPSSTEISVTLGGPLSKYARIMEIKDMPESGNLRAKMVIVRLKLPAFIENPGVNKIDVTAADVPADAQGTFGTAVTVVAPIRIHVPYPGIYVITRLEVRNVNENETVDLNIIASNLGYENISEAWGEIDVSDPGNKTLASLKTPVKPLLSNIRDSYYAAKWPTVGYKAGDYTAKARFYYRNNISYMQANFKIGRLVVNILNYTQSVNYKTINPFKIIVQSGWNGEIQNVYGLVTINGTTFQTPSIDLPAWEQRTLHGYFDTNNVKDGVYNAEIVVYFQGSSTYTLGKVTVMPPPKKKLLEQPTIIYGGVIGLLLVILIILLILFLSTRRKKQKGST
jgi:hypothetical protein